MSRALRELATKFKVAGYEVEYDDPILTVDGQIIDCSSHPNCLFLENDLVISADKLFNWFQLHKLVEQIHGKLFQIEGEDYMIKLQYTTDFLSERILKAWGLVQGEPLEVAFDVTLSDLQPLNIRVFSKGAKPGTLAMLSRLVSLVNFENPDRKRTILDVPIAASYFRILNRFCCICCRQHPPGLSEMLLLFPCSNLLCSYAAQSGQFVTSISLTGLKLLARLFLASVSSIRQELICQPFPILFANSETLLLHPVEKRDIPLAKTLAQELVNMSFETFPDTLLAHWITTSNKTLLIPIDRPLLPVLGEATSSLNQYTAFLTLANSPEKMAEFESLRKQHGSVYVFHGSGLENWHRILHDGLKNASGTALQTTGAVHGPGIYLSPSFGVSLNYSKGYNGPFCIAICEVINAEIRRPTPEIWVCGNESHVQIRFLLSYDKPVGYTTSEQNWNTIQTEVDNSLRRIHQELSG